MINSIQVIIYDTEGNVILNDNVASPFVGLQAGETFWFGSSNNKTWAKVISISYGVDTSSKILVVEMIVERTQKKATKTAKPGEFKTIDHGEVLINADYLGRTEGKWKNKEGTISVFIRSVSSSHVNDFILMAEGQGEPRTESREDLEIGEFVICKTKTRSVKCTLLSIQSRGAIFRITERIPI